MAEPTLHCRRLDDHDPHEWISHRGIRFDCSGRIVTSVAERAWAKSADAEEAADDYRRTVEREDWIA